MRFGLRTFGRLLESVCRTNIVVGVAILAGIAAFAHSDAGYAQTSARDARPAGNQPPWVVNCVSHSAKEPVNCEMSETLASKNTGQRVVTAVVTKKQGAAGYTLRLVLPLGLYLPQGASVSVDQGAKSKYPIVTADQNGSYANGDISSELLGAMKKGADLNVAVKSAGGKDIVLQLSLAGFSAALDKL